MSATVQCQSCGRIAFARIIEDDPSTNAFECEPDWKDEDYEWEHILIDEVFWYFQPDDTDCKLFMWPCEHEEYEVLEINHDYGD